MVDEGNWITASEALLRVCGPSPSSSDEKAAKTAIETNLMNGTLLAKPKGGFFYRQAKEYYGSKSEEMSIYLDGIQKTIPSQFWLDANQEGITRNYKYEHNDFSFSSKGLYVKEYSYGKAFDVHFFSVNLPSPFLREHISDINATEQNSSAGECLSTGQGRPREEWWPDFVAELVAYVKEVGIPDGIGHQGQSVVLKEVSDRLVSRGKPEPGRTQTQDTINAVLRRLRSAGN